MMKWCSHKKKKNIVLGWNIWLIVQTVRNKMILTTLKELKVEKGRNWMLWFIYSGCCNVLGMIYIGKTVGYGVMYRSCPLVEPPLDIHSYLWASFYLLVHNQQYSQCCFYSLNKFQSFQPEQHVFHLSTLPVRQEDIHHYGVFKICTCRHPWGRNCTCVLQHTV